MSRSRLETRRSTYLPKRSKALNTMLLCASIQVIPGICRISTQDQENHPGRRFDRETEKIKQLISKKAFRAKTYVSLGFLGAAGTCFLISLYAFVVYSFSDKYLAWTTQVQLEQLTHRLGSLQQTYLSFPYYAAGFLILAGLTHFSTSIYRKFPRVHLTVPLVSAFVLVNLFFLWSTQTIGFIPNRTLAQYVYDIPNTIYQVFGNYTDYVALTSLILGVILSYLFFRNVIKITLVASLALIPVGPEAYFFNNSVYWNLHVTSVQVAYNFLVWFTNADLFFSALSLFSIGTLLLERRRLIIGVRQLISTILIGVRRFL